LTQYHNETNALVKPQINEGSGVKLKIQQEVSNVVPSASAVDVVTSKRKIKTTVMVENNKILVLGGYYPW
jgi:general secretion pathway protein D